MGTDRTISKLRSAMADELVGHILPFWMERTVDERHGGFVGRISHSGRIVADAPKGAVLGARILWTFSAAHRALGGTDYARLAHRAYDYFTSRFLDPEHGGVFWSLDASGRPLDTRKQTYAQAFGIYGLSEYARAFEDDDALECAVRLFELLEDHVHEGVHGGYVEAVGRNWSPIKDMRLSPKDMNAPRSMNTHLHMLEALTNLYRVRPGALVATRLRELVEIFLDRILDDETGHLESFFGMDWTPLSDGASFGHDIEASWLLLEAADVLGDEDLRIRVRPVSIRLADVTLEEGLDDDGGVFNEIRPSGGIDTDKHWWPQAEAVVGFFNAFSETGRTEFLAAAEACWSFVGDTIVDRANGEWFFRVDRAGRPYADEDKVGMWKCPYHSARAALEIMSRTTEPGPIEPGPREPQHS